MGASAPSSDDPFPRCWRPMGHTPPKPQPKPKTQPPPPGPPFGPAFTPPKPHPVPGMQPPPPGSAAAVAAGIVVAMTVASKSDASNLYLLLILQNCTASQRVSSTLARISAPG